MPKRDFEKERAWIQKMSDYEKSGLSFQAWCEKNGEKLHTFKYWREKIRKRKSKVVFKELKEEPQRFPIEIHRREFFICLPNGCDQKTLKECLLLIEKN